MASNFLNAGSFNGSGTPFAAKPTQAALDQSLAKFASGGSPRQPDLLAHGTYGDLSALPLVTLFRRTVLEIGMTLQNNGARNINPDLISKRFF